MLLVDEDARAIKEHVPDVHFIAREVDGMATIITGNTSWITGYRAVESSYTGVHGVKMAEGRFFNEGEVCSGATVVVLSAAVAGKLFGEAAVMRFQMRRGRNFDVITVL